MKITKYVKLYGIRTLSTYAVLLCPVKRTMFYENINSPQKSHFSSKVYLGPHDRTC